MQVQIKRQLKIELDQADITTAVGNFLAANGYQISDEDLARINFVKSPKDGLRAELNINEATEVADEPVEQPHIGTTENPAVEDAAIADLEAQPTATAVPEESAPADDPGAVEPSTVEDVAAVAEEAVEAAVDRAFTPAADEEEEEVVPQGIPTSLFK
jgi:nucleotide-binding universal stress UspA family protein